MGKFWIKNWMLLFAVARIKAVTENRNGSVTFDLQCNNSNPDYLVVAKTINEVPFSCYENWDLHSL